MNGAGKPFSMWEMESKKESVDTISMDIIKSNPFQPRSEIDQTKIQELAQSIKTYGLLQPVMVRPKGGNYELVVGERRLLACRSLGWSTIRAVVKDLSDNAVATIALIEKLQRENLSFIEEAEGYAKLINEFKLTQEVLAQRLGKSQSTIANKLRVLRLSEQVKRCFKDSNLTERHARALLKLNSENEQLQVVKDAIKKGLNVKQTEKLVDSLLQNKKGIKRELSRAPKGVVRDLRIFLNTIRQALQIIENAGLTPEVQENDSQDYFEVIIRLPKKQQVQSGLTRVNK